MSIQHLFTPNTYDLNCNSLTATDLIPGPNVHPMQVDNFVCENVTVGDETTAGNELNITTLNITDTLTTNSITFNEGSQLMVYVKTDDLEVNVQSINSCSANVTIEGVQSTYIPMDMTQVGRRITMTWPEFSFQAGNTSPLLFDQLSTENIVPINYTFKVSGLIQNDGNTVWNNMVWKFTGTNGTSSISDGLGNTITGATYTIFAGHITLLLTN